MTTADEAIKRIRAETARRKKLWRDIVVATREAYIAVEGEARRRRIPPRVWLDNQFQRPHTFLNYDRAGDQDGAFLEVMPNGAISVKPAMLVADRPHQGYPNVTEALVEHYRRFVVEQLMGELNDYAIRRRQERSNRKR